MTTREELEAQFLTAEKLYQEINELVWQEDLTYLEATVRVCEEKQIDFEDIKKLKLVSPNLYDRLRMEAMDTGQIKRESVLPI